MRGTSRARTYVRDAPRVSACEIVFCLVSVVMREHVVGDAVKSLRHEHRGLGARFVELDALPSCERAALRRGDGTATGGIEVLLVPDEHDRRSLRRVASKIAEPALNVREARPVCNVVDEDRATGAAIVRARDRPEFLCAIVSVRRQEVRRRMGRLTFTLTGSVPDLQTHGAGADGNGRRPKVHPDRAHVIAVEGTVREAPHERTLPHVCVAYDEQLERHRIPLSGHHLHRRSDTPTSVRVALLSRRARTLVRYLVALLTPTPPSAAATLTPSWQALGRLGSPGREERQGIFRALSVETFFSDSH